MKVRNWGPRKFSGRGPFKELGMVLRLRTFPLGSAASRVTSTKNPERNISIWHLPIRSFAGSRLEKEHAARGQAIANSKEELESLKAQAGRSLEASKPRIQVWRRLPRLRGFRLSCEAMGLFHAEVFEGSHVSHLLKTWH